MPPAERRAAALPDDHVMSLRDLEGVIRALRRESQPQQRHLSIMVKAVATRELLTRHPDSQAVTFGELTKSTTSPTQKIARTAAVVSRHTAIAADSVAAALTGKEITTHTAPHLAYRYLRGAVQVAHTYSGIDLDSTTDLGRFALRIAHRMPRRWAHDRAAFGTVITFAPGDPSRAHRVALTIINPEIRVAALAAVATATAENSRSDAQDIAAEALAVADTITDQSSRVEAVAQVAETFIPWDLEQAHTVARQARHLADTMPEDMPRATALATVATAYAALDPGQSRQIIEGILAIAAKADGPVPAAMMLAQAARACASIDRSRAIILISAAKQRAGAITSEADQSRAFAQVARVCAAIDPGQAVQVVGAIRRPAVRLRAIHEVLSVFATLDPKTVAVVAGAAVDIARSIPDLRGRSQMILGLLRLIRQVRPRHLSSATQFAVAQAHRIPRVTTAADPRHDAALAAARGLDDPNRRAEALAEIAETLPSKEARQAIVVWIEALDCTQEFGEMYDRLGTHFPQVVADTWEFVARVALIVGQDE